MNTEGWNAPKLSEDERALERREHPLRAMERGLTIKIMPGSQAEMRAQLERLIDFELSIHEERTQFCNPCAEAASQRHQKNNLTFS